MKSKLTIALLTLLLASCANLKLTTAGEKTRVLEPSDVESCRKLGKTSASVTSMVMGVARPDATIVKELRIVARNSAVRMGGDTVVPLTIAEDGQQTFDVYKCINP